MSFYPKFNCELDYFEFFWGAVKWHTRGDCSCSFALTGLDYASLHTIQRFANQSGRWIYSYIAGLNDMQKEFSERQEKSHRCVRERLVNIAESLLKVTNQKQCNVNA